jgi:hypothetical protein
LRCFAEIDVKFWQNCINHCRKIEENYWKIDGVTEKVTEKLVINFGNDSETDDYDSEF